MTRPKIGVTCAYTPLALSEAEGAAVAVPPLPDTIGALGAALIARERDEHSPTSSHISPKIQIIISPVEW